MERLTWRDTVGQALLAPKYNDKYDALELIDMLLDRLAAYEDTGLEPEKIKSFVRTADNIVNLDVNKLYPDAKITMYGKPLSHWQELSKAESEGRLLVLPCKPMTTVYVIEHVDCYMDTEACPLLDESGRCNGEGEMPCPLHIVEVVADINSLAKWIVLNAFGKTAFLTHEEAEATLERMNND